MGKDMSNLESAIALAVDAHKGQVDKAGEPYILHPLRVMLRLDTFEERIVGILHDVVEDTAMTLENLREKGFADYIIDAIDSITKRTGEAYDAYVARAAKNSLARRVKIADLEDNIVLDRIKSPTRNDYERFERYRRALEFLQSHAE